MSLKQQQLAAEGDGGVGGGKRPGGEPLRGEKWCVEEERQKERRGPRGPVRRVWNKCLH